MKKNKKRFYTLWVKKKIIFFKDVDDKILIKKKQHARKKE